MERLIRVLYRSLFYNLPFATIRQTETKTESPSTSLALAAWGYQHKLAVPFSAIPFSFPEQVEQNTGPSVRFLRQERLTSQPKKI
jgi:hypothetical protein